MKLLIALAAMILPACSTPALKIILVDGKQVIEHLDEANTPCGWMSLSTGCFREGNPPEVWYSSMAPKWVKDHEHGHVRGMRHTEWKYSGFLRETCAKVYVAAEGYPFGAVICNNGQRERVIEV